MQNILLNSNLDCAINRVQEVKPALHEKSPLQTKGGDEKVESDPAEAVAFQEGHEKAKTHKDHHMHILKTCQTRRKRVETVNGWIYNRTSLTFHLMRAQQNIVILLIKNVFIIKQ